MSSHFSADRVRAGARPLREIASALSLVAFALLPACTDSIEPVAPLPRVNQANPLIVVTPGTFTGLTTGAHHTCALRSDGVAECWGLNSDGQAPATRAATTGVFTSLGAGTYHMCGVRSDGAAECWGHNYYGQAPATRAPSTGVFTQLVGGYHTCGLRSDGVAECWGSNIYGQAPPTQSATTGSFTQLSSGIDFTCGLRTDGVVECWGYNYYGEAPPTRSATTGYFTQVASGAYSTCGLRDDGVAECWGYNNYGQAPATKTASTGTFTQLAPGFWHSCGLRDDGVAECWGDNSSGAAPATRAATVGVFTMLRTGGLRTCGLRSDGVVECWGANYFGEAPATRSAGDAVTHVLPTATFTAAAQVIAGQSFTLTLSGAQVPGHPEATTFTYAFDCGDGAGYTAPNASPNATCPTTTAGSRTVRGKVIDQDNDFTEYTATVAVIWPFTGFFQPVDNPPVVNTAKAGSANPLKFSLGGDFGLNIIAPGYPISVAVDCGTGTAGEAEPTDTPGASSLSYSASTKVYTYVWKTDKAWKGACRQLVLKLIDGTTHTAEFRFK